MPMIIAARNPSNTIDKNYAAGYLWLSSLDLYETLNGANVYGSGNLYYQAGYTLGVPDWTLISSSTGTIVGVNGTANQITSTVAAGVATLSIPTVFVAPGSIAATTTLTATLGNITATNGNLVLGTAGNKIISTSVGNALAAGANSFGTVPLTGGAAIVSTTAVTATSLIFLTSQALGTVAAPSALAVTAKSAGVSFTITASQATDTSTIAWMIVN
jgi:hypothetical protein